jgi:hypothetical protein
VPEDLTIHTFYALDLPGRALTNSAGAADLLVIGSSGGITGATRRYCARHTRCPLVVVPRGDAGELLGSPIKVIRRTARNLPAA